MWNSLCCVLSMSTFKGKLKTDLFDKHHTVETYLLAGLLHLLTALKLMNKVDAQCLIQNGTFCWLHNQINLISAIAIDIWVARLV